MDTEFSVELGANDPTLAVPWQSPDGKVAYVKLRDDPTRIASLEEVRDFPELAKLLRAINAESSAFETAKCDVWLDSLMDVDDEPYGASLKCGSYLDLFFSGDRKLASFAEHERVARTIVQRLRSMPDLWARAEVVLRRAYFGDDEGLYWTVYLYGYGENEAEARASWAYAMQALEEALMS